FDHHMDQGESSRRAMSVPGALGGRTVLRFDGVDDYMETPNGGDFDGALLTILLVIVPRWTVDPGVNPAPFAIRGESGPQTRLSVHVDGGYNQFGTWNAGFEANFSYSITPSTAYYLDLQRASGNYDHYVNGALQESATQPLGDLSSSWPVRIGAAEDDYEN